jgi:hypothetical protein
LAYESSSQNVPIIGIFCKQGRTRSGAVTVMLS